MITDHATIELLLSFRDKAESDYQHARDARKAAEAHEKATYRAWMEARVAYATAAPHPWAGKAVKRATVRRGAHGFFLSDERAPDRNITERGTVTLCGIDGGYHYRVHNPAPGEWFVLSKSGQTAHRLNDSDGNCLWEVE